MYSFASRLLFVFAIVLGACGDSSVTPDAAGNQCADGVDNDGDGMVDFPDDLGCVNASDDSEDSPPMPACSDNRDNDGDNKIDYPIDPGCAVPQQDSELDDCPSGPTCAQCADGEDNDGNGSMDFPDDPGCTAAGDGIEFTDNQVACGAGLTISQLPPSGMSTDMLVAGTSVSNIASPCGGGGGVAARAYVFQVTAPTVFVASTGDALTDFDTVLDLRQANCQDPTAEVACHDDISTSNDASTITKAIGPGTYYLIVSGKTTADVGTYVLNVQFLPGEGQPCAMTSDCGTGLVCRVPVGQTAMVCTGPVCSDGRDDDGDGKTDYPVDPGCTSMTDDTEDDTCSVSQSDPACPACANGVDDDNDGQIDYPNDPTCISASVGNETCQQSEPITQLTMPSTPSTTVGLVNDHRPPPGSYMGQSTTSHLCSTSSATGHTAPDRAFELELPATLSLSIKLAAQSGSLFDSSHSLYPASCGGAPIECYDSPTNMSLSNLAGGIYYLVVDGYSTGSGAFLINVAGVIAPNASCEAPLAQSGALVCSTGYTCGGAPGSRTCIPAECNDGMDNNGDGRMDFPADPGCTTVSDADENTVCPGASCPACADGADNDGDGMIDYPMDTDCVSASAVIEGCRETEPVLAISQPTTNGTLVGATDDHNPTCDNASGTFPDRIYSFTVSVRLETLTIDAVGSTADTVLSFMNGLCDEPSLACETSTEILMTNVDPGTYTIAVDADTTTLDTFNLNVRGTAGPNAACDGALFQSGVLACRADLACKGLAGQRTCQPAECFDGLDNNGDGRADYPSDPGCTSGSDDTEQDVCPGASCPVCADGADNDGDMLIDFPSDPACTAASSGSESCVDTDAIQPITLPFTSGTLVGTADDRRLSCSSASTTVSGPEVVYTLTLPLLQSLTIDTEGSTVETALALMNADCSGVEIACDDDGGVGTGDSLIQRSFVQPGTYTVHVEADTTSAPNTYNLNVRGVIPPGASCENPLVDTGVLTCAFGFACNGAPGSRSCTVAACADGVDNNGDGRTDYPFDPSCDSFSDGTEETVCPGPNCPVCGDGIDNDEDGTIDYPADPSCVAVTAPNETCRQSEANGVITQMFTNGTTTGAVHDFTPSCTTSTSPTGPDRTYQLDVPATLESLVLDFRGIAGAHTLYAANCTTEIACSDPEVMTRTNVAPGTYYVSLDSSSTTSGDWTLRTTGVIAPGGSCEGPLADSGAFVCSTGHVCTGAAGARTCTPGNPTCSDGMDNDGDGAMDFPADPGCTSAIDSNESDPCPGAGCPACANGMDDDADSMVDAADNRCVAPSFFLEDFCPIEANVAGMIARRTTAGTLAAPAADNFEQSCQVNTGNDMTFGLELPVPVTELVIHTLGSQTNDTVISLWPATCAATTEIACDDDSAPGTDNRSLITVPNLAAGNYAIQVDGFSTSNNLPFLLTVQGTVAAGTACTSPLFETGVLACASGTTCTAGTCQ
jgi:hypothetical protein